jgi:hypothetical protein
MDESRKETAVEYLIRQLKYTYDAKKAMDSELDVDDIEYFGAIALKIEYKQLLDRFGEGYHEGLYDAENK